MNRYFRRLARFGTPFAARRSQGAMHSEPSKEPDPRAKSARHKKSTADKWNQ